MNTPNPALRVRSENEYEDLLGQWSDLESGLGVILTNPEATQEFSHRVVQYDRWMQGLMQRDPDVGLYLLFQLASNSPVGYSASHSLVCSVLCHLLAAELGIPQRERNSMVRAALTMNIGMTALQDLLATQLEKPTPQQLDAIRAHPIKGSMMLTNLGVADNDWLDIVSSHHEDTSEVDNADISSPVVRLTGILKAVDRYAAMISPRQSRAGRSSIESVRAIMTSAANRADDIGQALVRAVGLCPPGTYVRMDDDELGVVLRRSAKPNHPFVALVAKGNGEMLSNPLLHSTADKYPRIRTALTTAAVRVRLNHFHVLQLGAYAADHYES